jgi:mono/diheme cytochrome c family protein
MATKAASRIRDLAKAPYLAIFAVTVIGVAGATWAYYSKSTDTVDFSRDIRPIFNQNCASCHGGVRQKAGVSFLFRSEALGKGKSGRPTIVPGDSDASELIRRIVSKDPDARMPYHAPPLLPEQIALLRRWIKQGAQWSDYWAFVPPKPQPLPGVKQAGWVRQPLDRFVLARLERESLAPSPEAEKADLLRRVSLDLTGLPPSTEEQAAFLADQSPDACSVAIPGALPQHRGLPVPWFRRPRRQRIVDGCEVWRRLNVRACPSRRSHRSGRFVQHCGHRQVRRNHCSHEAAACSSPHAHQNRRRHRKCSGLAGPVGIA